MVIMHYLLAQKQQRNNNVGGTIAQALNRNEIVM